MTKNQLKSYKDSSLLLSEKTLLAVKYYSPERDPFVGLVEGRLNAGVELKFLSQAYQSLTTSRTSLQILFEKTEDQFLRRFRASAFKELKEFKNKEAFLLWQDKTLDFETGPLHEMAVYKTFLKSILCLKFHHLVLDGFSLFIFFKELTEAYHKALSGDLKPLPSDFLAYQQLMSDFFHQERSNAEAKSGFWLSHLKNCRNKDSAYKAEGSRDKKLTSETKKKLFTAVNFKKLKGKSLFVSELKKRSLTVFLKRKYMRQIYNFKAQEEIGLFYIFLSLYSQALKKNLKIDSLCMRIPFSARYHLKKPAQKNLLASLSRSAPLFVPQSSLSLENLALNLRRQARAIRNHLLVESSPWRSEELKSFSNKKKQALSLAMSYFPYKEKGFIAQIQNFYWQRVFLDLVLFVILSEKKVLLSFSYNPSVFLKTEIKNLAKAFQKEIESIKR